MSLPPARRHRRTHFVSALATLLPLALAASLALTALPARAEDRATAEQLFVEAGRLRDEGRIAEACAKFEGAAQLSQTPGVRLNLGDCYVRLGKTASAWTILGEAETIAERLQDGAAAELAHKRRAELEPKLARLTIAVAPAARAEGLEVLRDGKPVIEAAWGMAVPVDPGAHVIEARAPGKKPRRIEVVVKPDGDRQSLAIAPLEPDRSASTLAPAPTPMAPIGDAPVATSTPPGSAQRTAGWVLGGAGLAVAGAGVAVALTGVGQQNAAIDAAAAAYASGTSVDGAQSDYGAAANQMTAGYVVIGIGGAALVTGLILLATAPSATATKTAVHVAPWLSASSGGAAVGGAW